MYNQFFGLQEAPFSLTPNPRFMFLPWRQNQALAGLTYALLSRKGCIMLTGDIGAGKTTLVAAAMQRIPADRVQFSLISNPTFAPDELVEAALLGFQIEEVPAGRAARLAALGRFAGDGRRKGRTSVIVIDEAQKLSTASLEEVRQLANIDSLEVVLVGQNELRQLIDRPEVRAVKQKIALHLTLDPLSTEEVGQYIAHRWSKAGGEKAPFSTDAIEAVVRYSGGTPRIINVICDNALILAYGEQNPGIAARHIVAAAGRLKLPDLTEGLESKRGKDEVDEPRKDVSLLRSVGSGGIPSLSN